MRLAMIGSGWISKFHLEAFDRLGRTRLVGVASAHLEHASAVAGPRGAQAYDDIERMLDDLRPEIVLIAVPPWRSVQTCQMVVDRSIPFLVEKPLAAEPSDALAGMVRTIADRGLVAAVGYQLRGLEQLPDVRSRLDANPAILITARWQDDTPGPAWWRRASHGGGQVVEQATHLFDLARYLLGEAEVVDAVSTRSDPVVPEGADVMDATVSILRFDTGAIGSFANTRRQAPPTVDVSFSCDGPRITIRRLGGPPGDWEVLIEDGDSTWTLPAGRDPYERQAEAFLNAVDSDDPAAVLCTYEDALRTDRLTRAVVAATGRPG